MLLGELPERELFRRKELAKPLQPYFELTQGSDAWASYVKLLHHISLLSHFLPLLTFPFTFSRPHPQAVRMGDVSKFSGAIKTYGAKFRADQTFTLILRLRHSVIKTGIRMMSLSYSRISLQEMAQKLQLDSAEDAEFITAKVSRALAWKRPARTLFKGVKTRATHMLPSPIQPRL